MTDTIMRDEEELRGALAEPGIGDVRVTLDLPRETAERVLTLLEAESAGGAWVLPVHQDLTTTQAARVLGVSRPHLVELLDEGAIEYHKVGSHRRIPVVALREFHEERERRRKAAHALSKISDDLGLDN
ncbi:excisionase family DNA-binding protein [Brevibacterium litoralis]|uniref:excisionase family DNA-binding protein n=1 Tax=Brevibacterium litoralis TaxID=3138935 RepID=UPI0032EAFCB5